jgi:DNA-binding transcriptional LysR family regulator
MRLSIRALQYFLAAADRGSIARAAEELHVAPSAIASAIDQVEAEFGLKLVQRFPARGISPTAPGRALMRKIRHLIEEYGSLLAEGTELRTALTGTLSVGYYAPVAAAFMPAIVASLMRGNPDLRLRFTETDNERAQTGLLDGSFDAIVFVAENVRPGIVCEPLIEAPPYLLVPRGHPLSERPFIGIAEVAAVPLVLLDLPFTGQYLRKLLDANGIDPAIVATASTTEMVRSLVGAGLGCSILNMRPANGRTYADDEVAAVPIRPVSHPLPLVLGHLGEQPRLLVLAFLAATLSHFQTPAAARLVER